MNGKIPYKKQEELDNIELLSEFFVRGTGHKYCYCPGKKSFVKISRGQKVFVIDEMADNPDKCLIYTWDGFLVEIELDELIETGFD